MMGERNALAPGGGVFLPLCEWRTLLIFFFGRYDIHLAYISFTSSNSSPILVFSPLESPFLPVLPSVWLSIRGCLLLRFLVTESMLALHGSTALIRPVTEMGRPVFFVFMRPTLSR